MSIDKSNTLHTAFKVFLQGEIENIKTLLAGVESTDAEARAYARGRLKGLEESMAWQVRNIEEESEERDRERRHQSAIEQVRSERSLYRNAVQALMDTLHKIQRGSELRMYSDDQHGRDNIERVYDQLHDIHEECKEVLRGIDHMLNPPEAPRRMKIRKQKEDGTCIEQVYEENENGEVYPVAPAYQVHPEDVYK